MFYVASASMQPGIVFQNKCPPNIYIRTKCNSSSNFETFGLFQPVDMVRVYLFVVIWKH